jgi:hypothetical protein
MYTNHYISPREIAIRDLTLSVVLMAASNTSKNWKRWERKRQWPIFIQELKKSHKFMLGLPVFWPKYENGSTRQHVEDVEQCSGRPVRHHVVEADLLFEREEYTKCRSQRPSGLRIGSGDTRLLGLWVRIPPMSWMSVVSAVWCQVEISALGWSLVKTGPTVWCV